MQTAVSRIICAGFVSIFLWMGTAVAQGATDSLMPGLFQGHYIRMRSDTSKKGTIYYQTNRAGGSGGQNICTPPSMNPVSNTAFCNGGAVASIPFTASNPNALFTWTNNNTAIGLPASGTGPLPAFTATNTGSSPITATITVTPKLSSNGDVYIANEFSQNVSLIDPNTNTVAATIPTLAGNLNVGVSISPDNTRAYVSSYSDGYVHVINTATRTRIASINVGGAPFGISAGNQRVFVTDISGSRFWVIDANTLTVIATITMSSGPQARAICLSPDQTRVYISCSNDIWAYDAVSLTPIASRAITGTAYGLAVSSDGLRLFYADLNGNYGILNTTGLTTIYSTFLASGWGAGVCVNQAGTKAYIAHQGTNTLYIHDISNSTIVTLPMPINPTGVSLSTDESMLYVANIGSNNVSVVNTATNSIVTYVAVGNRPVSIGDFVVAGDGCTGTPISFDITVNPTPTVNIVSNQTICNGGSIAAVDFSSPTTGGVVGYSWTNDNPSIGIPSNGTGNIASFTAINAGTSPITATITVTPTFTNNGVSCTGTASAFTITVNPTPTVNAINNQTICNGASSTGITFNGSVAGAVYDWANNNPAIGLASSGTGDITSFTAVNAGTTPIVATITVTPSYTNGGVTCTGTPQTFTITVNPTPNVNAVANQLLCSGTSTSAVTFSGSVAGTLFNWTNDTPSIGIGASGSGNINSFTAVNNGSAPLIATITITPAYTNGGVTCLGAARSFTITINPSPTINPISNQILCDRDNTAAVVFGSPVTGTTYTWTNTTTSIGLAASGSGTIFSFNAINTTPVPVTATITATPRFTSGGLGCTGTPRSFTIQVNPKPNVVPPNDQAVCNGLPSSSVVLSGFVTGTVFNWTNNTPSIGLPASGTGNIPSFVATNSTPTPIVATITITPSNTISGVTCTGFSRTFTITVNPTPTGSLATPPRTFICEGTPVTLSASGGATYQWYLDGGLIPGVSVATYDALQPGTYTVVPTSSFGCRGTVSNPVTLTLINRPQPDFSFDKYCAGFPTQFTNLSQVNGSGAVLYAWNFGDGVGVSAQTNPIYTYNQPGTYNATLIATPVLCPSLLTPITKPITVIPPPANIRYPTVNAVSARDLTLQARTFAGAAYQWLPPTGLNNPVTQSPVFNSTQEQQYRIRIVTTEGCIVTDTLLVRMFPEREIYVAGGFTPNGDGKNDKIIPKLVGIKTLRYFKVYDRWGQLLYQTNIEGQGWDGTLKGVPQPIETYVWIAEGIDLDDKIVKRSGDFILFR